MAMYLLVISLIAGDGFAVLACFDPNGVSPVTGSLLHLSVSAVYGATFGVVWKFLRRLNLPGWLSGLGFGIALFLLAEFVLLPSSQSPLVQIPLLQFGIAHVIYGLILGWLVGRNTIS